MTVWAWLKLTACLWLIRKAARLAWWLLLAVAAVAAWPVTLVTAAGYMTAWLRGWPPARLYRAAAWSLLVTAAWLAGLEILVPGFLAARTPGRAWSRNWGHLDAAGLAGVFASLAPAVLPAGLTLAGLVWAWRNYAVTAGLGGRMASAPITFDARQWNRQVRTAQGLTAAPGAVPLLTRGSKIPVGGTIRRLLIRAVIAAALSLAVLQLIPAAPAAPADVLGLILWFVLTGHKDLAPPPER